MDVILNYAGSIASIVSLAFMFKSESRKHSLVMMAITAAFGLISSVSIYQYRESTQPEVIRSSRMNELKKAANNFISENKESANYWSPGTNEGLVRSGLGVLEMYRDIIPETYESIKGSIETDIAFGKQHRNAAEERVAMENAARSIVTLFKSLASGNQK